jgi:hypothetical protein
MARDRNRNAATETNEFSEASAEAKPETTETATTPVVETTPTGRPKKKRTPTDQLIAGMKRGERAIYYSRHYTQLQNAIADLKTLVGEEAVKLAEEQFLQE